MDLEKQKILDEIGDKFKGCFVAGGAINSVFTNRPIEDFDFYFKSKEHFLGALEDAYCSGFRCVALTRRAITFKKHDSLYQFMFFRWFPTAAEIFDSFDFTCCMGALDVDEKKLVLHERFMADTCKRDLVFHTGFHTGTAFPLASALRVFKYQKRGYNISKLDWLKVVTTCMFKRIDTWEALEEQLGGSYGESVSLSKGQDFTLENVLASLGNTDAKTQLKPPVNEEEAEAITDELHTGAPDSATEAKAAIFGTA